MKILAPRKELTPITFLRPVYDQERPDDPTEYEEEVRNFWVREKLRPEAAEFIAMLNQLGGLSVDVQAADLLVGKMLKHALAHPEDRGEPLSDFDIDCMTEEIKAAVLDLQGELYGFREEEDRLGKKLLPVLESIYRLRRASLAAKMTPGSSLSLLSPITSASTPTFPIESGPTESSTTSTDEPAESNGENESSNDV